MPSLTVAAAPRRTARPIRANDAQCEASDHIAKAVAGRPESMLENACGSLHGEIETLDSMLTELARRTDAVRRPADVADEACDKAGRPVASAAVMNVWDATEKIRNIQARVRAMLDTLDT